MARDGASAGAYAMIVATNLIVVLGVLLWDWRAREVLLLYGVEILVAGVFAALRIASADTSATRGVPHMGWGGKLICTLWSLALWGPLWYVYLLGLAALYPDQPAHEGSFDHLIRAGATDPVILVGMAALVGQYGWLFFSRYLGEEEYRGISVAELIIDPLRHVIVSQAFGIVAIVVCTLQDTTALLIIPFILIRIGFELYLEGRDGLGNPRVPE